jgi:diadenosine tetraphosphate (Ap4A) HIT family hydrolase
MHCSFCAIVVGDLLASFVYDDPTLAFLGLNPATPGHLL